MDLLHQSHCLYQCLQSHFPMHHKYILLLSFHFHQQSDNVTLLILNIIICNVIILHYIRFVIIIIRKCQGIISPFFLINQSIQRNIFMLYTIYSFTVSNVVYIMCKCYIFPSTDAEESSLPFSHVNFHFLNEDDLFDDEAGVEGFYIF